MHAARRIEQGCIKLRRVPRHIGKHSKGEALPLRKYFFSFFATSLSHSLNNKYSTISYLDDCCFMVYLCYTGSGSAAPDPHQNETDPKHLDDCCFMVYQLRSCDVLFSS